MAADHTYLYLGSAAEAKRKDELSLWRESHRENIACKKAIEDAVRRSFDGMRLDPSCIEEVLQQFGYKRTAYVLSNTLQQKNWDGRFHRDHLAWAKLTFIPDDHARDFVVESHPAMLDGFVTLYRKAYQTLALFGPEHCEPSSYSELDYEGKVLVLSPDTLKESCWAPENQLWLAHDGFGCSPRAIGRSIRCTCLGDGEVTRWNRAEFVGVLKEEFLPDWAAEKLAELDQQEQAGPAMGGMTMK